MRRPRWLATAMLLLAALAGARPSDRAPGLLQQVAEPLVIHHALEHVALADALAARGPGEVTRIALGLGLPIPSRIDVFVIPSRHADPAAFGLPAAPDWAAGYALVGRAEIVLRTTQTHGPTGNDMQTVFSHELVHCLVSQAVGARRHADLPAWFVEGIASHLASEWRLIHSAHVAGLALSGRYVPLRHLEAGFPTESSRAQLAYLESFAFVQWLADRSGDDALRRLLLAFREGRTFDAAFLEAFGAPWSDLEDEWRPGFLLRHRWAPVITSSATLWAGVVALVVAGGLAKRRRSRATLLRWDDEERAQEEATPENGGLELPELPGGDVEEGPAAEDEPAARGGAFGGGDVPGGDGGVPGGDGGAPGEGARNGHDDPSKDPRPA